jgi:hypothetical protein
MREQGNTKRLLVGVMGEWRQLDFDDEERDGDREDGIAEEEHALQAKVRWVGLRHLEYLVHRAV